MYYSTHDSPVGELVATAVAAHGPITGLYLPAQNRRPGARWLRDDTTFATLWSQLDEYFVGTRARFDLPIAPAGTPLQLEVWGQLRQLESGDTVTYGELAVRVGRPGSARAVGSANARNPISIVIPCHRVIGRDGSLTGYAGGLPAKHWLLTHEGVLDGSGTTTG